MAPYVVVVYKDHEGSRHEVVASLAAVEVSMDRAVEVVVADACRDEALGVEDTGIDEAPKDPRDWLARRKSDWHSTYRILIATGWWTSPLLRRRELALNLARIGVWI